MDQKERSELLRQRFKMLSCIAVPVVRAPAAKGLIRAKVPPGPARRQGVTDPIKGRHTYDPFSLAFAVTRMKWLEVSALPKKGNLALKKRIGVCPLVRIAAQYPKRMPRVG